MEWRTQDMAKQTFPAGSAPRIVLNGCSGDLDIEVWDERSIEVETDGAVRRLGQNDEALVIEDVDEDLLLRVPHDAEVLADEVGGDLTARGFRALTGGDVEVRSVATLTITDQPGGDVDLHSVGVVEIEQVGGDFQVVDSQSVTVNNVGGDCSIGATEVVRYGNVAGDLQIEGNRSTAV